MAAENQRPVPLLGRAPWEEEAAVVVTVVALLRQVRRSCRRIAPPRLFARHTFHKT